MASVLPFHRAVREVHEFTEDSAVYTRWIETDFARCLAAGVQPADRVAPAAGRSMLRLSIEIDGKRHELSLPQGMLGPALPAPSAPSGAHQGAAAAAEGDVTAPVAGTLTLWQAEDRGVVAAGQPLVVFGHEGGNRGLGAAGGPSGSSVRYGAPLARTEPAS